jgi:hypothetical protein
MMPNAPEDVKEHADPFLPRSRHGSVGRDPSLLPEEEIYEAVFRYQLQQPLADRPQPPRYYLALRGPDPREAFPCSHDAALFSTIRGCPR